MQSLRDKVAVVTGAASGVGLGLAERFAAEGMKVVLADVEEAPLKSAVERLRAGGAEAVGVRTDVRHESEVQALADATLDAFGEVHLLCNNAGVETGGSFAEIPTESWKWVLDVNLWGVLHGCRIFLPLLRRHPEAHIVNTGSGASFSAALPTFAPYITSKFAVLGLSESLDMELRAAGDPVRVSFLAPIARRGRWARGRRRPRGALLRRRPAGGQCACAPGPDRLARGRTGGGAAPPLTVRPPDSDTRPRRTTQEVPAGAITHRAPDPTGTAGAADVTESTVLGPFHMVDSPLRALGHNISGVAPRRQAICGEDAMQVLARNA